MENHVWVVVSDKNKTRIFERKDPPQHWAKVELFERGKHHDAHGTHDHGGGDHQGRQTHSHHEATEDRKYCAYFSEVTNFLRHAHEEKRFQELYVVAGPATLGEIRDHLDKETTKAITKEINKDLAHFAQPEIEKYLKDEFVFFGKVN